MIVDKNQDLRDIEKQKHLALKTRRKAMPNLHIKKLGRKNKKITEINTRPNFVKPSSSLVLVSLVKKYSFSSRSNLLSVDLPMGCQKSKGKYMFTRCRKLSHALASITKVSVTTVDDAPFYTRKSRLLITASICLLRTKELYSLNNLKNSVIPTQAKTNDHINLIRI